jgi:hypothetical protein
MAAKSALPTMKGARLFVRSERIAIVSVVQNASA